MADRPTPQAAPSYSVQPWATTTNYPAGSDPWSGQPSKVAPPSTAAGFVPNQGAAAEYFNWLFNHQGVRDQAVKDYLDSLRTKFNDLLSWSGQLPALNFNRGALGMSNAKFAHFDKRTSTWLVVGNSAWTSVSVDNGLSWFATQFGHDAAPGTETFLCVSSNDNGATVISTDTRYVYIKTSDTSPEDRIDVFGAALTGKSAVFYDASHTVWVCALSTSTGAFIRTSGNQTAWTLRTPPAAWNESLNLQLLQNPVSHRLTLVGIDTAGHLVQASHSDDGGSSWSAVSTLDASDVLGTSASVMSAAYDAAGLLMLTVSFNGSSGANATSGVWTSSNDGATWTEKVLLTSSGVRGQVSFGGGFWVAVGNETFDTTFNRAAVVYTIDDGATWHRAGFGLGLSPNWGLSFYSDGIGGALVLLPDAAYTTLRTGLPTAGPDLT